MCRVTRTCCAITVIIIILLLIALALLIFFLYPRIPSINESPVQVNHFGINSTYMYLDASINVTVNNTNYVKIHLSKVNVSITQQEAGYLGNAYKSDFDFSARKDTVLTIPIRLEESDPATALLLYESYQAEGYLTVRLAGPITVSYLGVSITREINQTTNVNGDSLGADFLPPI